MKMNKKLLRIASVFFVLLALIGCGIATIFYYEVSYAKGENQADDEVKGKFEFINDDSSTDDALYMITPGKGPSLLLGYIVTDSQSSPSCSSQFISTFNTKFRKNGYSGLAVSSLEILSVSYDNTQYALYKLSDSEGTVFKSPLYVASANDRLDPTCEFTLTLQDDFSLKLAIPNYTLSNTNLCRYNGNKFSNEISKILNNSKNYPDYSVQPDSTSLYVHLYGAMNVSEGEFSNIFWSPLYYLGSIELE